MTAHFIEWEGTKRIDAFAPLVAMASRTVSKTGMP